MFIVSVELDALPFLMPYAFVPVPVVLKIIDRSIVPDPIVFPAVVPILTFPELPVLIPLKKSFVVPVIVEATDILVMVLP